MLSNIYFENKAFLNTNCCSLYLFIFHFFPVNLSPCPRSPFFAISFSFYVKSLTFVCVMLKSPKALISSFLFAYPPAFIIFSSMLHKYCYYGPNIDPGLAIRIQPMKSAGGNPQCFIIYNAIKEPVLPSPALQCIAIDPFSASAASKN